MIVLMHHIPDIQGLKNPLKLNILVESEEAGVFLISDQENRNYYMLGHLEYDRYTLQQEYNRYQKKGVTPQVPEHYFPNNATENKPILSWHMAASSLFSNWLNHSIYQNTPYNLKELLL